MIDVWITASFIGTCLIIFLVSFFFCQLYCVWHTLVVIKQMLIILWGAAFCFPFVVEDPHVLIKPLYCLCHYRALESVTLLQNHCEQWWHSHSAIWHWIRLLCVSCNKRKNKSFKMKLLVHADGSQMSLMVNGNDQMWTYINIVSYFWEIKNYYV